MSKPGFKDTVTVVVGASRGIGAATVRRMGLAGGRVAWTYPEFPHDVDASKALFQDLESAGAHVRSFMVDCTRQDATDAAIAEILRDWGRLDYLVYCAGFTSTVAFLNLTVEEWRRISDVNLTGAFIAAHACLPHMVRAGNGSIVLVGSAAFVSGGGGRADYTCAKAGLDALCRAITREFSPQGIRCNAVHPSLIDTELLRQRHSDPAKRAHLASDVPLRRLGRAEDVAAAVAFFLSDDSAYVTGQSLLIDGGRTLCR